MFCEAHTDLPVAKTSKKDGKKGRRHHNLSKPLTTTLCCSSQRIHSAFLNDTNGIWYWEESWKNWGHRWVWNPTMSIVKGPSELWEHCPQKEPVSREGAHMIKQGKNRFQRGLSTRTDWWKNRLGVGGEEQKVEDRVMGGGKKLNRMSGPFSWMLGRDSKIMTTKRTESRVWSELLLKWMYRGQNWKHQAEQAKKKWVCKDSIGKTEQTGLPLTFPRIYYTKFFPSRRWLRPHNI